ncbi:MAG: hypothetical protein ACE5PM_06170 [Candidatus Hydrothermarchaeales archaeon]
MAFKLMVCRDCDNMFRINVAEYMDKEVKCPKCDSGIVTGIYEYWGSLSSSKEGFTKLKTAE